MVTRDTAWLPGTPCWVELSVDSAEKATAFYSSLFGWDAQVDPNPDFGGHVNFTLDGKSVAGVSPTMEPGQPQLWGTYLASDDLERTAEKIREAGGQLVVEPMDIGEHGRMLIAVDPAGAMFGAWQAGAHTGFQLANEPGSVTWNEQLSLDFEGSKKFYTELFGFEYGDMDGEMTYATMDLGGSPVGGLGVLPAEDMPPHWLVYFAVTDTDATVAKLEELGGMVLKSAFDTPIGRIAVVTDDQHAPFAVISVNPTS